MLPDQRSTPSPVVPTEDAKLADAKLTAAKFLPVTSSFTPYGDVSPLCLPQTVTPEPSMLDEIEGDLLFNSPPEHTSSFLDEMAASHAHTPSPTNFPNSFASSDFDTCVSDFSYVQKP
eukprot:TRINITY_DN4097_c0_g1_i1.p4 TRINITY_DN4097_c0_g1~~TRINITY_DN4097_c0_g1_i1.p4  ORF type:complete len:118 (+),score=44.60 TRINITY_DN4097_c0_g1_i1:70-423(+)